MYSHRFLFFKVVLKLFSYISHFVAPFDFFQLEYSLCLSSQLILLMSFENGSANICLITSSPFLLLVRTPRITSTLGLKPLVSDLVFFLDLVFFWVAIAAPSFLKWFLLVPMQLIRLMIVPSTKLAYVRSISGNR